MALFGGLFGDPGAAANDIRNAAFTGINTGVLPYYNQGINQLQGAYGKGIAPSQQTFQEASPALQQYLKLIGAGPGGADAIQSALQKTPGYQFNLSQGLNAIDANAAKTGQLNSGNTQLAAQQFGSGLASNTYQNAINNAAQAFPLIQASQSNIGNLYGQLGSGEAGLSSGIGNAIYGANAAAGQAQANADLTPNPLISLLGGGLGLGANLMGLGNAGSRLGGLFSGFGKTA